ncbi:ComEA family DNA-binding protein [Vibrio cincinnatiensis]|uniref:ComEA family DNA-binding protein n=1 Tax=Vibrio cincinnatiensis TaxID=675 RepID=UPI0012AC79F2|nr:ComEA family DNA-binding protein [Vibrio cincinnatiensis]MCG3747915.1 ComEA family DNA-binding protein [Vibrio cincinnatiensis]MCG3766732.1 ComEA family DNA-binding protein [Vibrio cincinnatiensis]
MMLRKYVIVLLLGLCWPTSYVLSEEMKENSQGFTITVNINTASAEEIATLLQGVGLQKAQAIVEYRETNGAFLHKEDLAKVKGIGGATVRKNEKRILL